MCISFFKLHMCKNACTCMYHVCIFFACIWYESCMYVYVLHVLTQTSTLTVITWQNHVLLGREQAGSTQGSPGQVPIRFTVIDDPPPESQTRFGAPPHAARVEAATVQQDSDELNACLIGLAKNAQQVLHYTRYGMVGNYLNERVFTPRDVYPADDIFSA